MGWRAEGEVGEKGNACASFQHSGAWELRQLGRALRNILSCNVNMSELWGGGGVFEVVLMKWPFSGSSLWKRRNTADCVCTLTVFFYLFI